MKSVIILVTILTAVTVQQLANGQTKQCQKSNMQRYVAEARRLPKRGVEYAQVAKFKLATRKAIYHTGEMISLDMAILNASDVPLFFHDLSGSAMTLTAYDETGKEIDVISNFIAVEGVTSQSFNLLSSDEVVLGSFNLLASCNVDGVAAFDVARNNLDKEVTQGRVKYGRALFERNLFINWGHACLRLTQPGTYNIIAEVRNRHVIVSSCEANIKTAVGAIRSEPLTLQIVE